MILLETQTNANRDLTDLSGDLTFAAVPASPTWHRVYIRGTITNLPADSTRNLRVLVVSYTPYTVYADYTISLTNADEDDTLVFPCGPFMTGGSKELSVLLQSDNAGDVAVTVSGQLLSDDLDYYLARRAAEESPTDDSPIARLKTFVDLQEVVE